MSTNPITATLLGTGTSVGVPVIGCDCPVCTSAHPGNQRTRSSLHLQLPGLSVLVDSGPDLRQQALRESLHTIDAVLYTHSHLDHVAGFDELRAFCWHRESPLPLHAGPETLEVLARMFPWAMSNTSRSYVRPALRLIEGPFELGELTVTPVPVVHPSVETFGFRFDLPTGHSLAYLSDVKEIPSASLSLLEGLEVLIIDALRPKPHPTHMNVEESLAAIARIQPVRSLLTHLAHEIDYRTAPCDLNLPESVTFARDGLRLSFESGKPCAMIAPLSP
ncbi:MAG: MBL fold metallo-hydrolase [Roseibacillus sp.]|nr:MBL fold metallo-hydrolase [Roseibacillus sp.]